MWLMLKFHVYIRFLWKFYICVRFPWEPHVHRRPQNQYYMCMMSLSMYNLWSRPLSKCIPLVLAISKRCLILLTSLFLHHWEYMQHNFPIFFLPKYTPLLWPIFKKVLTELLLYSSTICGLCATISCSYSTKSCYRGSIFTSERRWIRWLPHPLRFLRRTYHYRSHCQSCRVPPEESYSGEEEGPVSQGIRLLPYKLY